MSDVTLSKAVRSNLLHLQNTAKLMDITQERLATGKKVNSALDNPTNFFTASALNARAGDIGTLLDSMSNGIRTIEMADNGLTAITDTLESMQSTLRQARQDKSFQVETFTIPVNADGTISASGNLSFSGGAFDASAAIALTEPGVGGAAATPTTADGATYAPFSLPDDGTLIINGRALQLPENATAADIYNTINGAKELTGVSAELINAWPGEQGIRLIDGDGKDISLEGSSPDTLAYLGFAATLTGGTEAVEPTGGRNTLDKLISEINSQFAGKLRASNDKGGLRIENLSTSELTIGGIASGAVTGSALDTDTKIGGNTQRANLADQFNELRSELDRLAEDASYNGVNLLRGDELKIVFNEMGTSIIQIQTKDAQGNTRPINSSELGLFQISADQLESDTEIDDLLHGLQLALGEVRSQASDLGSTLSVVQNRENFTKQMINTLETGAANLTLADTNEEGANLLALQTRQQLSQTALSLASQADQAVLRLFG